MSKLIDLTGQQFGSWKVVKISDINSEKRGTYWLCECRCGVRKDVSGCNLRNGASTRCRSCYMTARNTTHGYTGHPLIDVFYQMRRRCQIETSPDYPLYGGRGITLSDELNTAEKFIDWCLDNGWQYGLEIDRIDNNGNYEPSNIRFCTRVENVRNRNNTKKLTYKGVTKPMAEWAEIMNIQYGALANRLRYGWSVEDALERPLRRW